MDETERTLLTLVLCTSTMWSVGAIAFMHFVVTPELREIKKDLNDLREDVEKSFQGIQSSMELLTAHLTELDTRINLLGERTARTTALLEEWVDNRRAGDASEQLSEGYLPKLLGSGGEKEG